MPRRGALSMKTASPFGQGGTSRGVREVGNVADEQGTPTTPAVAVGHGIPSSTEEGKPIFKEVFEPVLESRLPDKLMLGMLYRQHRTR